MTGKFDSAVGTRRHIEAVQENLNDVIAQLTIRGGHHDQSKLDGIERDYLDEIGPQEKVPFRSPEYMRRLELLQPMLEHHFANNSHHPEHYPDGIRGMDLLDLIEMLADWKAAAEERNDTGFCVDETLDNAPERWALTPEMKAVLRNTAARLGWSRLYAPWPGCSHYSNDGGNCARPENPFSACCCQGCPFGYITEKKET